MFKFLLHVCCAPCSIAVIDELKDKFDLTVFFYNPNIFPETEYHKRKKEVIGLCGEWGVPIMDMDYEAGKWLEAIKEIKNYDTLPEGGSRCEACLKFRIVKAAEYAKANNFAYFGTSLSSGRNKNSRMINAAGKSFGEHYGVSFYDVDWKKGGRQEKSAKMTKERGVYRQDYCGCAYSISLRIND